MTEFHTGESGGSGGEKKPSWRRTPSAPPVPAVPAGELPDETVDEGELEGHTLIQPPASGGGAGAASPGPEGERTMITPSGVTPPSGAPLVPATPVGSGSGLGGSGVRPGTGAGGTLILSSDAIASEFPAIPGVTITREIGRGGMGVVYEGTQGYLDRRVAVKLLAAEMSGGDFTRRFQREAKILASLGHSNIVACYQAGVAPDGRCFLVMEFIDGLSLEGLIAKHGALPPSTATRVCQAVASALAFAHGSGIIHRDVKPANVLLKSLADPSRDTAFPWQPMLADLGLARVARSSSSAKLDVTPQDLTQQGTVMGSPPTMAPEQFDAPDEVDFRTDVYGLGCVLFHALTGKQAFPQGSLTTLIARKTQGDAPDPRELRKDVPRAIAELVKTMLARRREDRPASYEDLLARFATALAAPAAPPARSKAPLVALGVVALAGAGFLASRYLGGKESPTADGPKADGQEVVRLEPDPLPVTPAVTPDPVDDGGGEKDAVQPDPARDGGEDRPVDDPGDPGETVVTPPPEPEPEPVQQEDPSARLPRIQPEETWPLFHGSTPLEAWQMSAGKHSDWSPLEESRNGAQAFVFESVSSAERELPAPPWSLTGQLEMVRASRVVTQRLALLVHLGPDDAIELSQGIVEGEVRLLAERVRGPRDAPESRVEIAELALAPIARADYAAAAPVAFRLQWDGERLVLAWSLARTEGSERTLELARSDFAGPVRLGFELTSGSAVLRDFVLTGL